MNKKAFSPLIATVLIIGFTVALSAIVMTWGNQFMKEKQVEIEEEKLECTLDISENQSYGHNYAHHWIEGDVFATFSFRDDELFTLSYIYENKSYFIWIDSEEVSISNCINESCKRYTYKNRTIDDWRLDYY